MLLRWRTLNAFVVLFSATHTVVGKLDGKQEHCYRKGGDWSRCAAPFRPYRKRSETEILAGEQLCPGEPLCWTQLDWRNTPLPSWECKAFNTGKSNSLQILDLSFHPAAMSDHSAFIETEFNEAARTNHSVHLLNCYKGELALRNYRHAYRVWEPIGGHEALECSCFTPPSETIAKTTFEAYREDVQHFDALMFTFGSSVFENWLTFNRSIILAPCHRVNQGRTDPESSARTFEHVRMLSESVDPPHIIGPTTLYEGEYLRHYAGIQPLFLPQNLFGAIPDTVRWTGEHPTILVNGYPPYVSASFHVNVHRLDEFTAVFADHAVEYHFANVDELYPGAARTFEALASHRAVLLWPYSVTNYRLVEQYRMCMPIFAPTPDLLVRHLTYSDRRVAGPGNVWNSSFRDDMMHPDPSSPYEFSPNSAEPAAERFWWSFAEVYHWPCVRYFSSFSELRDQLDAADLPAMSECMARANEWRRLELLQNWCTALGTIAPDADPDGACRDGGGECASEEGRGSDRKGRRRVVPATWEQALEGLGVDRCMAPHRD